MKQESSSSDALLVELGRIAVFWGYLDREINHCIASALICTPVQAAAIATELDNVAARCRLAISLTHTIECESQEWLSQVTNLFNHVANQLGPLRNRYMHDKWETSGDAHRRVDRRVRIRKEKSFSVPSIAFDNQIDVNLQELSTLQGRILTAIVRLTWVASDIEMIINREPPSKFLLLNVSQEIIDLEVDLLREGPST